MELVLDIVIILMIATMIFFAVVLNIKLKAFKNAQSDMAALVAQLNEAISRAQTSVEILKETAQAEEGRLQKLVARSRLLADELEIITETGSNLANRIESGLVPLPMAAAGKETTALEEAEYEEGSEMLETLKRVR